MPEARTRSLKTPPHHQRRAQCGARRWLDLHGQLKVAHWNLKGPYFAELHPLLETFAVSLAAHNDSVAERAVTLGAKAYGTARHVAGASRLPEYPQETTRDLEHVKLVADRMDVFLAGLRAARGDADERDDIDTVDLLTGIVTSSRSTAGSSGQRSGSERKTQSGARGPVTPRAGRAPVLARPLPRELDPDGVEPVRVRDREHRPEPAERVHHGRQLVCAMRKRAAAAHASSGIARGHVIAPGSGRTSGDDWPGAGEVPGSRAAGVHRPAAESGSARRGAARSCATGGRCRRAPPRAARGTPCPPSDRPASRPSGRRSRPTRRRPRGRRAPRRRRTSGATRRLRARAARTRPAGTSRSRSSGSVASHSTPSPTWTVRCGARGGRAIGRCSAIDAP